MITKSQKSLLFKLILYNLYCSILCSFDGYTGVHTYITSSRGGGAVFCDGTYNIFRLEILSLCILTIESCVTKISIAQDIVIVYRYCWHLFLELLDFEIGWILEKSGFWKWMEWTVEFDGF